MLKKEKLFPQKGLLLQLVNSTKKQFLGREGRGLLAVGDSVFRHVDRCNFCTDHTVSTCLPGAKVAGITHVLDRLISQRWRGVGGHGKYWHQ